MFLTRFVESFKKEKRVRRPQKEDVVTQQVKKVLTDVDQKLILMVRG